jgi:toxin FitB
VSFLLDTNVISEARKLNCNQNVRSWMTSVRGADLFLSVMVIGEIRQGIERLQRRDPARSHVYEHWLATLIRDYGDHVLAITEEIAQEWGRLNAVHPAPIIDGLLAATAKIMGFTLVTRNVADVASTGVRVLNPFES